jgi:hypothetical protein
MKFDLNTVFKFGKYKGKTLKQVIDEDINYVVWCLSDINEFRLDNDAIVYFIDNKDKISINHSHIDQTPMNALWEELTANKQIYSKEEWNAKWNKAIAQILKK